MSFGLPKETSGHIKKFESDHLKKVSLRLLQFMLFVLSEKCFGHINMSFGLSKESPGKIMNKFIIKMGGPFTICPV